MSAIWGLIQFAEQDISALSMASEYRRKCKLDRITEKKFGNSLFGSGLQFINDEDELESMPYALNDENNIIPDSSFDPGSVRTVITADCILDNRDELVKELVDNESHTLSYAIPDGELICLAFRKWHYDFPKHLKGLFSVAVFDVIRKELFLCVDQTASRCLYYYADDDSCAFSTLISPIRQLYPDIQSNEGYLIDFLALPGLNPNCSSTDTPWQGLYMVEAGSFVTISFQNDKAVKVESKRYYDLPKIKLPHTMEGLKGRFLEVYSSAASAAVRTSGEVSISLSSGFDSSSVAALSALELAQKGKKLHSYTYVPFYPVDKKDYPPNFVVDETEPVKSFAKMYPNIDTHFEDGDGESFLPFLDELCDILEIPYKAYVNLPILLSIYKKAQQSGSKVVLIGQVGNSTVSFGKINISLFHLYLNKKYCSFLRYLSNYCKLNGISRREYIPKAIKYMKEAKASLSKHYPPDESLRNPYILEEYYQKASFLHKSKDNPFVNNNAAPMTEAEYGMFLYSLNTFSYLGSVETKLGLYSGVVIRDVTRNIDVIEFCNSFPYEYFCYNGLPRYLIRSFMKDYLPDSILYPIDRYGLQNGDWLDRVSHSADEIYSLLDGIVKDGEVGRFLKMNSLQGFLEERHPFDAENDPLYNYIFIILALDRFMRSIKK